MNNHICFCCGNYLSIDLDRDPTALTAVYDGLWFRSYGNYGSSVFDPMPDDGFLQIVICDSCVEKKSERVTHIHRIRTTTTAEKTSFKTELEQK